MLADIAGERDESDGREPAMAAEVLVEFQKTYADFLTGCPFKPGDLITPRRGTNMKGAGKPHVVLEVRDRPDPHFAEGAGSTQFGRRNDIRVASFYGDTMARHWVESVDFDAYTAA
ncbi:hypothetical protein AB6806_27265 [Bosea sp. RCC_152_1]|uniref:hypothetical protein n=1 Tax=Bosea sp. RCC_152_1 TaxID=3239228 RepID=UPI003523C325